MNLVGSRAIVTGASQGIGLAITEALVARGTKVAGFARGADRLRQLEVRLGSVFVPIACDVGDSGQVERAIHATRNAFGSIDILINNAGVGKFGAVDEFAKECWDEMLATNLSGAFYCVRQVVPIMKEQRRGHIINVASIAGKAGYPNASAYNATKFALRGMGEALTNELGQFGIKVSTIFPGTTDTAFGNGRPAPGSPSMKPSEIAESVLHILERSESFLISEMVMRPVPGNT